MQRYYTPRKYSKYTLGSVTQQQLVSLRKQPVLEVGLKARRGGGGGEGGSQSRRMYKVQIRYVQSQED